MSENENGAPRGSGVRLELEKQKFYDYVRIHAIDANVISRADEKHIMGKGITDFGLGFQDAHGIFLSVAAERNIALMSHADHHIEAFLEQMVKRGKISKKHFNDAVSIYHRLTNGRVPESEVRKRVKELMQEHEWSPRRSRLLPYPGSKRWYNKI